MDTTVGSGPIREFSPRQVRVLGGLLVVIGTLLAAGMGLLLAHLAPTLMNPGVPVNGTRFVGTPEQGRMIAALLTWVAVLGITFAAVGTQQMWSGRRSKPLLWLVCGMVVITLGFVWQLNGAYG